MANERDDIRSEMIPGAEPAAAGDPRAQPDPTDDVETNIGVRTGAEPSG